MKIREVEAAAQRRAPRKPAATRGRAQKAVLTATSGPGAARSLALLDRRGAEEILQVSGFLKREASSCV